MPTSFRLFNHDSRPLTLEVGSLGWADRHQWFSFAEHECTAYEIIWIKKGTGSLTFDRHKLSFSENAVYCFAPNQYRKLEPSDGIEGYYISFSQDYLDLMESPIDFSFFLSANNREHVVAHPDCEMGELFIKMHREFSSQYFLRTEILKGMLKVFMIYLSRQLGEKGYEQKGGWYEKDKELLWKFQMLLKKHIVTKKLVADYADEMCITPNYLNAIVKKRTGLPASRYIQQHIITEAKRQVTYSRLSMKEVANKLGFYDYAHFSKFFKNYSGVNFSSFKKQMLAES